MQVEFRKLEIMPGRPVPNNWNALIEMFAHLEARRDLRPHNVSGVSKVIKLAASAECYGFDVANQYYLDGKANLNFNAASIWRSCLSLEQLIGDAYLVWRPSKYTNPTFISENDCLNAIFGGWNLAVKEVFKSTKHLNLKAEPEI